MCTFLPRMRKNRIIHIFLAFVSSAFSNLKTFLTRQKCFHSFQCCTDEKSSSAEIWDLVFLSSFHSQDRERRRMQPRECLLIGTLSRGCWYILSELNESRSQLDPHVSPAELKHRPARAVLTVEMWLLTLSVAEVIINYNYVHVCSVCTPCFFLRSSVQLLV